MPKRSATSARFVYIACLLLSVFSPGVSAVDLYSFSLPRRDRAKWGLPVWNEREDGPLWQRVDA